MHFVAEFLIMILIEWVFLLPARFIVMMKGKKFNANSCLAKDYLYATVFWAVVLIAFAFSAV